MMDWDSEYADESSPEYQNLTSEFIKQVCLKFNVPFSVNSGIEHSKMFNLLCGDFIFALSDCFVCLPHSCKHNYSENTIPNLMKLSRLIEHDM